MIMQKAGLLTALAVTVAVAIYAYPKTDRRSAAFAPVDALGLERDGSQPTPLEKLKAATRVGVAPQELQPTLPPPRVMESVKHEIQARPSAIDTAAAVPRDSGIDKLAARLPAADGQAGHKTSAASPGSAAPSATQSATLAVPGAERPAVASITAQPAAAQSPTQGSEDAVASAATSAKTNPSDRKRASRREATTSARSGPPIVRYQRDTGVFRNKDTM